MVTFITGISTGVGKTLASAIVVEALEADYWKPVQSGDLHQTDSMEVASLISNSKTVIHEEAYKLQTPASPHFSAKLDGVAIDLESIRSRRFQRDTVMEGAGGILVPLNDSQTILDLIRPDYKVIVVSRHYLGSINHTMLTLMALKQKVDAQNIAIIFNGAPTPSTESHILSSGVFCIGRIDEDVEVSPQTVSYYAHAFSKNLKTFVCR